MFAITSDNGPNAVHTHYGRLEGEDVWEHENALPKDFMKTRLWEQKLYKDRRKISLRLIWKSIGIP